MAASIFAPPRSKPKIMPTLAVGQPMPMQSINEPVHIVGANSGTVYHTAGDNPNGQEQVTVTPPPGPVKPSINGSMATGGSFLVGGDPAQSNEQSTNPYPSTIGTGIFSGNWQPPTQSQSQSFTPAGPYQPNPFGYTSPTQTYGIGNETLQNRENALNARAGVLGAMGSRFPIQQNVLNLRGATLGQQQQQNQMEQGYLQQQQGNEAARLGELQGIYKASQNTPDIINAGEAGNAYASENRRDAEMGVSAPATVNLPPGYNGPLPAGVRPKIMTQEQRLQEQAGYQAPIRQEQLAQAQIAVQLQGTNVREAELAAAKAGLSLDEANQMVNQAQLQEDYANLITSRSELQGQEANVPPQPGMVKWVDPATGASEWVTPEQHDELSYQYSQAKGAQRYESSSLAPFGRAFIERLVRYGEVDDEHAIQELMAGGKGRPPMTRQQAEQVVKDAHTKGTSTLAAITPGGPATPPTTTQIPAPAAAPTGTSTQDLTAWPSP